MCPYAPSDVSLAGALICFSNVHLNAGTRYLVDDVWLSVGGL